MAAPVFITDLVNLSPQDASTGFWSAIGGGASGLNQETDYFIQGVSCISKNAFANATKGMVDDVTNTPFVTGSLTAIYMWITHLTPVSLDIKANGGLRVVMGSAANTLNRYYYAGKDTIDYGAPWICAIVDPENSTADSGTVLPANIDTYGVEAQMVGGPTKGAPLAVDTVRQGRIFTVTVGDATDPITFTGAAVYNDNTGIRGGMFQANASGFLMQCLLEVGNVTTAAYFEDSNKNIILSDLEYVHADFTGFEITNAGTTLKWTKITITALGTNAKGNFEVVSSLLVDHTLCNFINMGWFTYDANSTCLGTVWRGCRQITTNGAPLTDCTVDTPYPWDTSLDGFDLSIGSSTSGFTHLFSAQNSLAASVTFNKDGTKFFILGNDEVVYEYDVPVGFDLSSSASYSGNSYSVTTQVSVGQGVTFNNDGTKMFIADSSTNNIFEYTLSIGFDLSSTVEYSGNSYNVGTQETAQGEVIFNDDGTKFFICGLSTAIIYEYTLSIAFDLSSTITYTGNTLDASTEDTSLHAIYFNNDGTKIFALGNIADVVLEYNLETAYDLSVTNYSGNSYDVTTESTGPTGLAFSRDGTKFYMVGSNTLHEYVTGGVAISAVLIGTLNDLSGNTFISNGLTHAVELTTAIAVDTAMAWDNLLTGYNTESPAILVDVNSLKTLTINVADTADTPTVTNIGNGTVTVVTGQKTFSFTVSPSITGYEWRLYEKDPVEGIIGTVELAGEEVATVDNQSYAYSYVADKDVVLQIIASGYEESLTEVTLKNADLDITINLAVEENT